jgi:hypothetical protein
MTREEILNDEGFDARLRNETITSCPHQGEDANLWRRGWFNAHYGLRDVDPNSDFDVPAP